MTVLVEWEKGDAGRLTGPCTQCGGEIEIPNDIATEWVKAGKPPVRHERCPTDSPLRHYVVQVSIQVALQGEDELARFSVGTDAESLATAMPALSRLLNDRWNQVAEVASLAETEEQES